MPRVYRRRSLGQGNWSYARTYQMILLFRTGIGVEEVLAFRSVLNKVTLGSYDPTFSYAVWV